jgi:hypothetical protein
MPYDFAVACKVMRSKMRLMIFVPSEDDRWVIYICLILITSKPMPNSLSDAFYKGVMWEMAYYLPP